jgi:gliding motility-associated-like protein
MLSTFVFPQFFVNNGSSVVSEKGSFIIVNGSYVNRNDGSSDGTLDLNGTIKVRKSWVNTANNFAIINIGTSDTGNVVLDGTTGQNIEGTSPTHFEDLTLENSKKTMKVSDCKVNNKLFLNSVLKLNTHNIILENPSPEALQYISGYILSETSPADGYGILRWNIGDSVAVYNIPFGSGNAADNDLNLVFVKKTPGIPSSGYVLFSTYPTACNNTILPTGVTNLDREPEYIVDRFWIIDPDYSLKPDIDIFFKYTDIDLNTNCNGYIIENELKAIRYNQYLNSWTDMIASGTDSPTDKIVRVENVSSGDFFSPWCLVNEVVDWGFFIPNAFTPNGDGTNDYFGPMSYNMEKYTSYDMYIYDRWGEMIFHTDNPDINWNGRAKNGTALCSQGIYTWLIFVKDKYGMLYKHKGIVSLVN